MNEEEKKRQHEPFGPIIRSMNDFFTQQPVRRLLDSMDEFFERRPFILSTISIDMYETDKELIISADLPGVKREQINIEYSERHLTISVNHQEELEETNDTKHYYVKKQSFKKAQRTIVLPYPITGNHIKASYRDGVLKVQLPKERQKKIAIDD
ncbi:Hsp20/alpha crystallin family protein [Ferdinandcohnia quinoae]|uniref:Hsp20/alpha crystallin family protein n=1 Tax=Fredinandcohnia quinoae TaxID=2918902 RepID=A0AAW5E7E1_9BACI|nr:Hsp20/alpha crystallin family protein [Fredinandcohnia sp. SECRCQ15]MCH1624699.1 Hsp20/alpha crystallin family protein [Fredinandcohnia sp. SECRCQ15]